MRTIYTVAPALTDRGYRSGLFTPVKFELDQRTQDDIRSSLRLARTLIPEDRTNLYGQINIDLTESLVDHGQPPKGLHLPEDFYVRVTPNFGLHPKRGREGLHPREGRAGVLPTKEEGFGVADIVAASWQAEQPAFVIVRDKTLRGSEDMVIFTPEFLKDSMRAESLTDVQSFVAEEHRLAMGRSILNMVRQSEGGWLGDLGDKKFWKEEPALDGVGQSVAVLRGLIEPQISGIADAVVRVNEVYHRASSKENPQGPGNRERI